MLLNQGFYLCMVAKEKVLDVPARMEFGKPPTVALPQLPDGDYQALTFDNSNDFGFDPFFAFI